MKKEDTNRKKYIDLFSFNAIFWIYSNKVNCIMQVFKAQL